MSGGTAFGATMRVLVVDDEQFAREELCFQLNQAGEVDIVGQATNGPEALTLSDELEPDVVFLDVQMPGLTGFEVARSLLQRADDAQVVEIVTANNNYGLSLYLSPMSGKYYCFSSTEGGVIQQFELSDEAGQVAGTVVRSWDLGLITEGQVCDDENAVVFFGEEDVG